MDYYDSDRPGYEKEVGVRTPGEWIQNKWAEGAEVIWADIQAIPSWVVWPVLLALTILAMCAFGWWAKNPGKHCNAGKSRPRNQPKQPVARAVTRPGQPLRNRFTGTGYRTG